MADKPSQNAFERIREEKRLPPRDVFDRLRDKKRAIIVLEKPSPEGREKVVALAKQHGLTPEREIKHKHSPHAQGTIRLQQDVTLSIDGLPVDPDGRVVVKQELAFDLDKAFPHRPKTRLIVTQTDRLVWLKGENAFARASEVVKGMDFAAASPAWRAPVVRKHVQRFALDPWAADLRIPKLREQPQLLKKLEQFGKLDTRPQFGGDWYELRFHEPPCDYYELAERFYEKIGGEILFGPRGITLLVPLATVPGEARYPLQRDQLVPMRAEDMWSQVNPPITLKAALSNVTIFALDIGVNYGEDAPLSGLSTSAHGVPGDVTGGGDVLPLSGAEDPDHGTKMVGIMAAAWTAPAGGSGIAGITGCCSGHISVASVTCVGLVEIAKSIDYAVTCLTTGGAAGHKGVILIGHDILQTCQDYMLCGCLTDKLRFDTALLRAEANDIVIVVPAGNYTSGPGIMPNVLPPTQSTLVVGASGDSLTGAGLSRWADGVGASKIGGTPTTGPSLIAPGANIYAVLNATLGTYDHVYGTSCAAAHVAGVAALLRAKRPTLTASQVKDRLLLRARPLSALPAHVGAGLLDGCNALL